MSFVPAVAVVTSSRDHLLSRSIQCGWGEFEMSSSFANVSTFQWLFFLTTVVTGLSLNRTELRCRPSPYQSHLLSN
jgi:hypothetical protein